MGFIHEERSSDSPYIEKIMRGWTVSDGSTIRPAESHWHMVFTRNNNKVYPFVVGPWTTSGVVNFTEGAEILWVKFRLGVYMPHLPAQDFLNTEVVLPDASGKTFWLKSSAWQFPGFDNVETFISKLVHDDVLVIDPVVDVALQPNHAKMSPRTLRYHFVKATGLPQNYIRQMNRAQQAAAHLLKGGSILDTVYELGYFDQPHMNRALKQFIGLTPGEIVKMGRPG